MIKVFVINLERAPDRLEHVRRELAPVNHLVDFQVFQAIDGRKGWHSLFEHYDDQKSQRWKGKSLSLGQLGCFASHYMLWKECVELNESIIVLEDDAVIDVSRFYDFLENIKNIDSRYECLRLFRNFSKHHRSWFVGKVGSLSIVKYTKGPMRATGYYLTPQAAIKFINSSQRWFLPVDMTMDRFWRNNVECFGVFPEIISANSDMMSTIGYSGVKQKRSFLVKVFREIYSFNEGVWKNLRNLRFWINENIRFW